MLYHGNSSAHTTHSLLLLLLLAADNSTLANMLPDIVDGAIELVMQSQGPDRRSSSDDDFLKGDLPGKFSLIFDEAAGYTYKGHRKGKAATKASKTTSTAAASDAGPAAASTGAAASDA